MNLEIQPLRARAVALITRLSSVKTIKQGYLPAHENLKAILENTEQILQDFRRFFSDTEYANYANYYRYAGDLIREYKDIVRWDRTYQEAMSRKNWRHAMTELAETLQNKVEILGEVKRERMSAEAKKVHEQYSNCCCLVQ